MVRLVSTRTSMGLASLPYLAGHLMDGSRASTPVVATHAVSLYLLALGTFAVGTEGFMIAGILPKIASDLAVTPAAIGQLVTVFAFAYALSSPILTALSGHMKRRTVLIAAMGVFVAANLVASAAPSYGWLMAARVVLAFCAGIYTPGANALAGALVPVERRGFAIAIINAGLTVAIALGVPLGTLVATALSWRMTFVGVAALSAIALTGLVMGLPKDIGVHLPVATLRERFNVARRREVLSTLVVTTLWATGAYTMYTYLALFLRSTTGLHGAQIGYILFLWGVSAGVGVLFGGKLVDRLGPRAVLVPALLLVPSLSWCCLVSRTLYHWLTRSHLSLWRSWCGVPLIGAFTLANRPASWASPDCIWRLLRSRSMRPSCTWVFLSARASAR